MEMFGTSWVNGDEWARRVRKRRRSNAVRSWQQIVPQRGANHYNPHFSLAACVATASRVAAKFYRK
jgi:hypothetical protein